MRSTSAALAAALAFLPLAAAQASNVCDLVAASMLKVGEQPGVHQKNFGGAPPRVISEAISLKDAMYMREGGEGPWRRIAVDQAKRRDLAGQALKAAPLSQCAGPRSSTQDGVPLQAYTFSQPDPTSPGQLTTSTLWVGADGLPRRMLLDGASYQTMEYGDFPAPTEIVEPRQRRPAR